MEKNPRVYLNHILEAVGKIEQALAELDEVSFMSDEKWFYREALLRQLEIIGEAAKNMPIAFKEAHSDIPWSQIAGMRNYLVHEYFAVNYERVWETAVKDIPQLKKQFLEIVAKLTKAS